MQALLYPMLLFGACQMKVSALIYRELEITINTVHWLLRLATGAPEHTWARQTSYALLILTLIANKEFKEFVQALQTVFILVAILVRRHCYLVTCWDRNPLLLPFFGRWPVVSKAGINPGPGLRIFRSTIRG